MKTINERATVHDKFSESGVSKAGKQWNKTTVIFKVEDNKNSFRFIPVTFFGVDEEEDAKVLNKGDVVDVEYYVTAREWQGRWFTEAKLFHVSYPGDTVNTAARKSAEQYKAETLEPQAEDLPF